MREETGNMGGKGRRKEGQGWTEGGRSEGWTEEEKYGWHGHGHMATWSVIANR